MTTYEMFERDIEDLGFTLWTAVTFDLVAIDETFIVQLLEDEYIELPTISKVEDWKYKRLKYYLDRLYAGSYEWRETVVF